VICDVKQREHCQIIVDMFRLSTHAHTTHPHLLPPPRLSIHTVHTVQTVHTIHTVHTSDLTPSIPEYTLFIVSPHL
jgi:hypothetical protein